MPEASVLPTRKGMAKGAAGRSVRGKKGGGRRVADEKVSEGSSLVSRPPAARSLDANDSVPGGDEEAVLEGDDAWTDARAGGSGRGTKGRRAGGVGTGGGGGGAGEAAKRRPPKRLAPLGSKGRGAALDEGGAAGGGAGGMGEEGAGAMEGITGLSVGSFVGLGGNSSQLPSLPSAMTASTPAFVAPPVVAEVKALGGRSLFDAEWLQAFDVRFDLLRRDLNLLRFGTARTPAEPMTASVEGRIGAVGAPRSDATLR